MHAPARVDVDSIDQSAGNTDVGSMIVGRFKAVDSGKLQVLTRFLQQITEPVSFGCLSMPDPSLDIRFQNTEHGFVSGHCRL
jgi:hypothetical protein